MVEPDALVIGPMKAGTTWLHDFLEVQGNVCLPLGVKETFYFDRYYNKGESWYLEHFSGYDPMQHKKVMEIASSYFHSPEAPQRIKHLLGEIPLVITFRDPVRRSWSHYLHLRRYGYTTKPLKEAALDYPELIEASCYSAMLRCWEKEFSADKLHVMWQEDLQVDPESYAKRFCELLNIPFLDFPEQAHRRSNEAAVPPSSVIAALGRKTSYILRERGLYNVVNLGKRLGLKRFFFGRPNSKRLPTLNMEDAAWLVESLSDDYRELPSRYKNPTVELLPHKYSVE